MGLLSTIGAASGRAFGLTRVGAAIRDAYFNLTTLLLPGNGTNGAQNNTFLDSSTNNFTITRNGNTTQGTFSPFSQTGWSNYFGGGGNNYLTVANNAALNLSTGDFTLEAFIYVTSFAANSAIMDKRVTQGSSAPLVWFTDTAGKLNFYNGTTYTTTSTFSLNTWVHVVTSRVSGTLYQFINGVSAMTPTAFTANLDTTSPLYIGSSNDLSPANFAGYISNLRIVKGTGVTSVTVPTSPLTAISGTSLLTCQSNRFIDNSSNAFTVTPSNSATIQAFSPFAPTAAYDAATVGGSGYFDGSDWLTVGAASDWTFMHNGSDWTCEFWVYHTGTAAYTIASTTAFSAQIGFTIAINSTYASGLVNGAQLYIVRGDGVSEAVFNSTALLVPNQWNYVAITFTSSTKTCAFTINGASAGSTANTGFSYSTSAPTNTLAIGRFQGTSPSNYLVGYLGSLRISTNIRTGLTTIPTSPYTSDANTKLLTNYTNAGITDATAKNDLETVGNAQISTTQSKFGGSSMYFDGTGDWLLMPDTPDLELESGDFTIEAWVYLTALNTERVIAAKLASQAVCGAYVLEVNSSNAIKFFASNNTSTWQVSGLGTATISQNTWTHIAVTRSGSTFTVWVNGTSSGTTTASFNLLSSGVRTSVGAIENGALPWLGYIDDLRITKGYARYTSNFTAPTAAFPVQ